MFRISNTDSVASPTQQITRLMTYLRSNSIQITFKTPSKLKLTMQNNYSYDINKYKNQLDTKRSK